MKKSNTNKYGQPVLLYPGMALRIGSAMQVLTPYEHVKKEAVDKRVDNAPSTLSSIKNKHFREVCLKSKH